MKYVDITKFIAEVFYFIIHLCFLYMLYWYKKLPEDNPGKIETRQSFDGSCVNI